MIDNGNTVMTALPEDPIGRAVVLAGLNPTPEQMRLIHDMVWMHGLYATLIALAPKQICYNLDISLNGDDAK
jgi:hypothetical protein